MTATFTVESITYAEGCTTVSLEMGRPGRGDERMGTLATINLSGHLPLNLSPGQLVKMTLEPEPTP
jgi:hypothetical protein